MKEIKTTLVINLTIALLQYIVLMYLILSLNLVNTSSTAYFGIALVWIVYTTLTSIVIKSMVRNYRIKVKEYRMMNR